MGGTWPYLTDFARSGGDWRIARGYRRPLRTVVDCTTKYTSEPAGGTVDTPPLRTATVRCWLGAVTVAEASRCPPHAVA